VLKPYRMLIVASGVMLALLFTVVPSYAVVLSGVVTDQTSHPVPGVWISAKNLDRKMAVSVLTDSHGRYRIEDLFPGTYRVRAHAIGYATLEVNDYTLTERNASRNFRLAPTTDIGEQMPADAWLATLPDGDFKASFIVGCTICHAIGTPVTHRPRTYAEWVTVIERMRHKIDVYSVIPNFNDEQLAHWLVANGFGPDRKPPHFVAPPRPKGVAGRVVVTEYDVGKPNTWAHDMAIEPATGMAWVGDYTNDELIRVDPMNGEQKIFAIPVKKSGVHTLHFDRQGTLWMTLQLADMVVSFNTKTEKFHVYKGFRKGSLIHSFAYDTSGYIQYDAHGRMWMSEFGGNAVASLEPKSGQIKEYDVAHKGNPYGIALDQKGRVWYTNYTSNWLGVVDPETGHATDIAMPSKNSGPHRMTIDAHDRLWIPESGYGRLAMYDIAKKTFTEYNLPDPETFPYSLRVDGTTGDVWVCGDGADSLYRFDPATKKFTTFRLPSQDSYTRMIAFDYASGDVWTSISSFPNSHSSHPYHGELVRLHIPYQGSSE
jgi:virginiamycin B lyase